MAAVATSIVTPHRGRSWRRMEAHVHVDINLGDLINLMLGSDAGCRLEQVKAVERYFTFENYFDLQLFNKNN